MTFTLTWCLPCIYKMIHGRYPDNSFTLRCFGANEMELAINYMAKAIWKKMNLDLNWICTFFCHLFNFFFEPVNHSNKILDLSKGNIWQKAENLSVNCKNKSSEFFRLCYNLLLVFKANGGIERAVLDAYCWMYSSWNIPQEYKGACTGGDQVSKLNKN